MKLLHPEAICYLVWIIWAASWWLAAAWSSRTQSSAGVAQQLPYRLLTILGFILIFAIKSGRSSDPFRLWTLPGVLRWFMPALCIVGFAFAWWARLHLGKLWSAFVTRKTDHRIIDTGPYGIVRHPIYTGIILAMFAVAILKGTIYGMAGAFIGAFGFWIKARLEERFLGQQLGVEAYDSYRRRVPMLIPFFRVERSVLRKA
jgi:protein-S-isoprenylcysteine O-methyltransferase Ste14